MVKPCLSFPSDSEDVALVVVTEVLSVNFLAHSLVEEGTDVFLIVDFDLFVSAGEGVRDVELLAGSGLETESRNKWRLTFILCS